MKNINAKNKYLYIILCLIVIAGAIVYFTKGFEFDMEYAKKDQIIVTNKTGIDISKINQISKEILQGKKVKVQEVGHFRTAVQISSDEITNEEKAKIVEKVNEEYSLDILADNVEIQNIEKTRIKDIIRPYILPIVVTFAIILFYFLIRYRKIGVKEILVTGILVPIIMELLYYSIIAICRIPFGDITTALAICVYAMSFVGIAKKFDRQIENIKIEETKK